MASNNEISSLITTQRDVASQIEILVVNIGKTSLPNRTRSSRLSKEEALKDLWKQFAAGHDQLSKELPGDHPYLALYAPTRTTLQTGLDKLQRWDTADIESSESAIKDKEANAAGYSDQGAIPKKSVTQTPPGTTGPVPLESGQFETIQTETQPIIDWSSTELQPTHAAGASYQTEIAFRQPFAASGAQSMSFLQPLAAGGSQMTSVPVTRDQCMGQPSPYPGVYTAAQQHEVHVPINGQSWMTQAHRGPTPVSTTPAADNREFASILGTTNPMPSMGFPGIQNGWPYASQPFVSAQTPKLAPITVPIFDGDWKKWTTFIGLFESLIDNNRSLAPVQKLQYLLNYLQGAAKEAIAHITMCNDNYAVAMNIIRRRFDNPRKICNEYVANIMDLPQMHSRDADGILKLFTSLTVALHGLQRYGYDTSSWAPIIVTCITRKLDEESRQKFEELLEDSRKVPTLDHLTDFLERRHQVLLNNSKERPQIPNSKKKSFAAVAAVNNSSRATKENSSKKCVLCHSEQHSVRECPSFLKKKVPERIQFAKGQPLCLNCLGSHDNKCNSRFTCRHCQGKHHTLLHLTSQDKRVQSSGENVTHSHLANKGGRVLLATALVKVRNIFGQHEILRALIDPGSQDSFITTAAADSLSLPKTRTNIKVSGIGGADAGKIVSSVELHLSSHYPSMHQFSISALVLPKLTAQLPEATIDPAAIPRLPSNLLMADPDYAVTRPIDLLLGAGLFAEIVKNGTQKYNNKQLLLQNTEFGWIISGRLLTPSPVPQTHSLISMRALDQKMNAFWEMEEMQPQPDVCKQLDEFFNETTTKDSEGRYTVRLPRKNDVYGQLGASRNMAIARLINQEKAFAKNPKLAEEYHKFLREYEEMGHMTKVEPFRGPEGGAYYLPHHAVIKDSSTTTKVRVVFNASAKTHTGLSLNSLLDPGHKQQQDLRQIILRWRKHRFVITADIEKMFRQILVAKPDRDLQRIVWRASPAEPIHEYQLNTVTYGTASATYLAVRVLLQLARDEGHQFPLGNEVLVRDFYMDDLLSGADTVETALQIQRQISELLSKGGFCIRKWTSNCREIIEKIPEELRETGDWLLNPDATLKTLGVVWNPQRDEFRIRFNKEDFQQPKLTKRALLSNIATIFDPLGFLAPISFVCKTWMQQLWTEETDWDEAVSAAIKEKWENLLLELPLISEMVVPRWINYSPGCSCQIHGFCDASEKGYAAVIYSRIVDDQGAVHINLLAAKTKVAPLKNKLTLPRMELAGATLLANLVHEAVDALEISTPEIYYWCDSQITLAWIAKPPTTWTTYVANRVASIQELSSSSQWRYVNTKDNPADVASRGCSPAIIHHHPLWWHGPKWLKDSTSLWETSDNECSTDLEMKPAVSHAQAATTSPSDEILVRFSSFNMLVRVVAWIRRFKRHSSGEPRTAGYLRTAELNDARNNVLRLLQAQAFDTEVNALQKKIDLPRKSRLSSLAPFLDNNGLLRVGGRLRHSGQPYNTVHPILLPRNHALTTSIIREAHQRTLHGGAQLTLTLLRCNFWISDGRATVQSVIRSCVRCRRYAATATPQQMGDLPATRVTPTPAFARTGVDYCGPFLYRCSKGRGIKTTKGYVAVFVCFSTKAIHLELVSDLTTDAFLAAFKRFVARRGLPSDVHSDNGTNFQGASREINREMKNVIKDATVTAADLLAGDGVTWHFITPASPHLGGLWEAGVKAVKKHMKRVLDDTSLTFEEFTTVMCQIEACVNSRPLFAVSNDPADLDALSPGHFLIMRPLLARPEPAVLEDNPVQRWRLVTKMHQDFWHRWSTEYLAQLQQRNKWKIAQRNPVVGELVLMKDKALPPAKWALGRIMALHPGDDQKIRLVTVRTRGGQVKQPMTNICSLLTPEDNSTADDDGEDGPKDVSTTKVHLSITRRQKSVIGSHVFLLIMMILAATCRATTIVKTPPGLYVERIGHCQLKRGTLRLQTQISFGEMREDERRIIDLGKNLSAIFNTWNQRHGGHAAEAKQYSQMFQHFENKRLYITERITELQTAKQQRLRRGLFGKLMTAVFGVNDEVYAELDDLQKGQLTNDQNVLRVSTMLERSHQDLVQHWKKLDEAIRHSNKVIHQLNLDFYRHTLMHHLAAAYTNAMAYLDEAYRKYDTLEKAVLGRSSIMELMPLQTVNRALRNATARLPHGYYVRAIPDQYVETNFTAEYLTISGFFPIASSQLFDLINVTPVPDQRNDTFVIPNLVARTVALNYNDQLHFELNVDQLAACQRVAENMYLCDTPVLSTMNFDTCSLLTEIYNRTGRLPCDSTSLAITGVLWQKLLRPNTWLFTTNTSTLIAVICRSEREDMTIMGSGIIKIEPGCMIKTASHTIHSLFYLDIKVMETFIKESILPLDSPIIRKLELKDPPPFADPMALIADLTPLKKPRHSRSLNLYYFSPWAVVIVILIVFYLVRCMRKRKQKPRPIRDAVSYAEALNLREQFDTMMASLAAPQHVQPQLNNDEGL